MTSLDTVHARTPSGQEASTIASHLPTEQVVAEAIYNTRRRYALYHLHKRDGAIDLNELVDQVAAWETCTASAEVPDSKRKSVYAALQQTHLPYLEERGLVSWNRTSNQVKSGLRDATLDLLLANDPHTTIRWYRVYLLVSAVVSLVAGLVWVGVGPFRNVSLAAMAGAVILIYTMISVIYWYDIYRWHRRTEGMPPDFIITVDQPDSHQEQEDENRDNDNR